MVGERWRSEVVEAFERDLLEDARAVQRGIRDDLADGVGHVHERRQRRRWRERAQAAGRGRVGRRRQGWLQPLPGARTPGDAVDDAIGSASPDSAGNRPCEIPDWLSGIGQQG